MAAGLKQKTHKVLDIEVEGFKVVCVVHYEQATNPFHLYVKWYDGGWKLKQVARYQNFFSKKFFDFVAIFFLNSF